MPDIIPEMNKKAGAAAAPESAGTPEVESELKEQPVDAPEKKYTDEDLDRILAGKIARERRKLTESISSQLAAELDKREHDILKRELMADAREKLIADRLPPELSDCLQYESKEAFDRSYSAVAAAFKSALQAGMNDRMRGYTPRFCDSNPGGVDRVRDAFARKD